MPCKAAVDIDLTLPWPPRLGFRLQFRFGSGHQSIIEGGPIAGPCRCQIAQDGVNALADHLHPKALRSRKPSLHAFGIGLTTGWQLRAGRRLRSSGADSLRHFGRHQVKVAFGKLLHLGIEASGASSSRARLNRIMFGFLWLD